MATVYVYWYVYMYWSIPKREKEREMVRGYCLLLLLVLLKEAYGCSSPSTRALPAGQISVENTEYFRILIVKRFDDT